MTQPAGWTPQYSNPGVATLGHVVASAANSTYETLVTAMVERMGLQAGLGVVYTKDVMARLADGYQAFLDKPVPFQVGYAHALFRCHLNAARARSDPQRLPPPPLSPTARPSMHTHNTVTVHRELQRAPGVNL